MSKPKIQFTQEEAEKLFQWYSDFQTTMKQKGINLQDNRQLMRFRTIKTNEFNMKDGSKAQLPAEQEFSFLNPVFAIDDKKTAPFLNNEELIKNQILYRKKMAQIDTDCASKLSQPGLDEIEIKYIKDLASFEKASCYLKIMQEYRNQLVARPGTIYEMDFPNKFKLTDDSTEDGLTAIKELKEASEKGCLIFVGESTNPEDFKEILTSKDGKIEVFNRDTIETEYLNASLDNNTNYSIDGFSLDSSVITKCLHMHKVLSGDRIKKQFKKNNPDDKELIDQIFESHDEIVSDFEYEVYNTDNYNENGSLVHKSKLLAKIDSDIKKSNSIKKPSIPNKTIVKELKNKFCQPDSFGTYPVLNEDNQSELISAYEMAISDARRIGNESDLKIFQHELKLLRQADLTKNLTMPTLLRQAEVQTLEISGKTLGTSSGQMSLRMPMTIVDENKEPLAGFFTSESNMDIDGDYQKALIQLKNEFPDEAPLFDKLHSCFSNNIFKNYSKPIQDKYIYNQLIDSLHEENKFNLATMAGLAVDNSYLQTPEYTQLNSPKFQKMLERYADLTSECFSAKNDLYVNELGLSEKINIDDRNVAFSNVAKLLDVEHLVPKSVPMQVQCDGKIINGTFMKFAEGVDISNLPLDSEVRNYGMDVFYNSPAIEQIADADILQYITQSADNHLGNIIYNFKKNDEGQVKLNNIQCIDNDFSFGLKDGSIACKTCVGLDGLRVISEKMATKVLNMTKADLNGALATNKLSFKEIDACWNRVVALQNKIKVGQEFYKNNPTDEKYLFRNQIRIVSSETFLKYGKDEFDSLCGISPKDPGKKTGFHKYCQDFHSALVEDYNKPGKKAELPEIQILNEGAKNTLHVESDQLNSLHKGFRKIDSFFILSSEEFNNVKYMLEDIQDYNKELLRKPKVNDAKERIRRQAYYKKLEEFTDIYLNKKAKEDRDLKAKGKPGISQYAKDRVDFIKSIKNFAHQKISSIQNFNVSERLLRDEKKLMSDKKEVLELQSLLSISEKYTPEYKDKFTKEELVHDVELIEKIESRTKNSKGIIEALKMASNQILSNVPNEAFLDAHDTIQKNITIRKKDNERSKLSKDDSSKKNTKTEINLSMK